VGISLTVVSQNNDSWWELITISLVATQNAISVAPAVNLERPGKYIGVAHAVTDSTTFAGGEWATLRQIYIRDQSDSTFLYGEQITGVRASIYRLGGAAPLTLTLQVMVHLRK